MISANCNLISVFLNKAFFFLKKIQLHVHIKYCQEFVIFGSEASNTSLQIQNPKVFQRVFNVTHLDCFS